MNNLILILSILLPNVSYGGSRIGNGGNVMLCADGRQELLDFYEMKSNSLHQISLPDIASVDHLFEILMDRLSRFDYPRSEQYTNWYKSFFKEAEFLDPFPYSVADTGRIVPLPRGCYLQLVVYQLHMPTPLGKRYFISKPLWDKATTPMDKVGLILHELIYREFLQYGDITSERTRYLHNWIFSTEFENLTQGEYNDLILNLGLISLNPHKKLLDVYNFFDSYLIGQEFSLQGYNTKNNNQVKLNRFYDRLVVVDRTFSVQVNDTYIESDIKSVRPLEKILKRRKVTTQLNCKMLFTDNEIYCEQLLKSGSSISPTEGSKAGTLSLIDGKLVLKLESIRDEDYSSGNVAFIKAKVSELTSIEPKDGKLSAFRFESNIVRSQDGSLLEQLILSPQLQF